MLKNKKATHVGKVLSFVVFIVFITFTYSVLQPIVKTEKNKQTLVDYLKIKITEKTTIKIKMISIRLLNHVSEKCIYLGNLTNYTYGKFNLTVHNITQNITPSFKPSDPNRKGILINRSGDESDFFKIFYSDNFDEIPPPDPSILPCAIFKDGINYSIGSISADRKISEKKLMELFQKYTDDYSKLKEELKIPDGNGFGLLFEKEDGTIVQTPEKEKPQNIYAEQIPIQYITKDAYIKSGFLTIKVW